MSSSLYESTPQVVAAELRSLKPESRVYERKSGLFFSSDRATALRHAEEAVAEVATNAQEGLQEERETST